MRLRRRKHKIDAETQAKLNEQYFTIASLLIKIVGETRQGKIVRAILIGGIAAAAQYLTATTDMPEGAVPEHVETAPASSQSSQTIKKPESS